MITVGIKLEGAKEFERSLGRLETKVAKKIIRKAVRAAQKPVLQAAKANAISIVGGRTGKTIAANLVIKAPRKQKRGSYTLMIAFKAGEKADPTLVHISKAGKQTFIPAALEFGHGSSKQQAARPFLRPAADDNENQSLRILGKEIGQGIDQEMRRK